ncbi:ATP-binding protein [Bdellovibrio sp. 22V]|uniref:sensor histidine kinase n=1 Tax=Bdellovibrio sp. 22V TaxID=3044166 RepID=UPI002542AE28|nr:ATP-binding protein [Bdellovibrio sp. 22V]WII72467.1 ATP-binding protein [Bdellovibrio sp. 22V]
MNNYYLANISHEIRTPLGAVLGFAEVLSQPDLTETERMESLEAIRRNGELLQRLIDDLLDLTKIEAQKLEFEERDFSVGTLLSDVRKALTLKAAERKLNLIIEEPLEDVVLRGDALRIKQILFNVIGNALKFTDSGGVWVQTTYQNRTLKFTVEDTGIGLTEDEVQRLFQPFNQADSSMARRFGGTGLGLVISRQLARLMGGDLVLVKSVRGMGSVFEISLKIKKAS